MVVKRTHTNDMDFEDPPNKKELCHHNKGLDGSGAEEVLFPHFLTQKLATHLRGPIHIYRKCHATPKPQKNQDSSRSKLDILQHRTPEPKKQGKSLAITIKTIEVRQPGRASQ